MGEVSAGPQYFTHYHGGREFEAWYYAEEGSVTVVWLGRASCQALDGAAPESAAKDLLERMIATDSP